MEQTLAHLQPIYFPLAAQQRGLENTHMSELRLQCRVATRLGQRSQGDGGFSPMLGSLDCASLLDPGTQSKRRLDRTLLQPSGPLPARCLEVCPRPPTAQKLVTSPPINYDTWSLPQGLLAEHRSFGVSPSFREG